MQKLDVGQTGLRRSPDRNKNVIDLKDKEMKKAMFERSNSKKKIKSKDIDEEHPDGNSTLPQSRMHLAHNADNLSASRFSLFPDEKVNKDQLILMTLSQNNIMQDSSAEKFKQGMRILYEDEYNLLNKIQKNAKYENSIDERKLNSGFRTNDYSVQTAMRTEAGNTPNLHIRSNLNTGSYATSPKFEDDDLRGGFGKSKKSQVLQIPSELNMSKLNKVQPK